MRWAAAVLAVLATLLLVATGQAAAQPELPAAPDTGLRLDVSMLNPRIVTTDGQPVLTVTGLVTNTGSTPVTDLGVRVQRTDVLRTEAAVREALAGSAADAVTPAFTPLPDLSPGGSAPVSLVVPLTGPPTSTLALTRAGVYGLLVNVNGSRNGIRARLAATRLLLPVLGLPGTAPAPLTTPSTPLTVLYPIVSPPVRLPTVPGEPTTLSGDDRLFAPGSRLDGLVDALIQHAPTGSAVRAGTCVAVDPALLDTAARMAEGYQVRAADGTLTPGTGGDAARAWLAKFAATVRGSCVLTLPESDADLVALVRGGAADLARRAVTDGRAQTSQLLGTPVLADTLWPADGALDEATLTAVGAADDGSAAAVLAADSVAQSGPTRPGGVVPVAVPAQATATTAVLTDPLLTLAATGVASRAGGTSAAGQPGALGAQDVVGALAFRALAGGNPPAPLVLAPPHGWGIDGAGAAGLLDSADRLIASGLVQPRALGAAVSAGAAPGTPRQGLVYPVRAGSAEIPPAVVGSLAADRDDIARLRAASDYEPGVGAPPDQVFDPLLRGILRGASAAWRGDPARATTEAALVDGRIAELVGSVKVLQPPGPFSLGTQDAPVPLTVANGLPITMTVRVELTSTAGLRVAPIPVQRVPPLGRVQVRVSTEVVRAGTFTVEASVRTPDGGPLGAPTRLQVRSTVYGTVTIWLTAVAGGLLVLLAGRRVWRRIRGDRKPPATPPDGPASMVGTAAGPRPQPARTAGPPTPAGHAGRPGMSSADTDLP